MKTAPPWFYNQSAVIPYRIIHAETEILLITSRRGKRWIIPKGVIDPGTSAGESAAKEAYEEAGIRGRLSDAPVGEYRYEKWGGICTVKVFLLEVQSVLDTWPEVSTRQRQWLTVTDAARLVKEPELQSLILKVPNLKS
ncbi:MAG TPA: NUDIX hydrolase [Pyrinomonadaceae bacterium]|jgi:8-oxo-dGTP pyrophosphatase MutT (NUDIX family)